MTRLVEVEREPGEALCVLVKVHDALVARLSDEEKMAMIEEFS